MSLKSTLARRAASIIVSRPAGLAPISKELELDFCQRSRTATREDLNRAALKKDPWYAWHVLHVVALVLRDNFRTGQLKTTMTPRGLAVLMQTPYAGTYQDARGFLNEKNLQRFIFENGLTYERLLQVYGHAAAEELTMWANQLEEGDY